jgi:hypothetical protein
VSKPRNRAISGDSSNAPLFHLHFFLCTDFDLDLDLVHLVGTRFSPAGQRESFVEMASAAPTSVSKLGNDRMLYDETVTRVAVSQVVSVVRGVTVTVWHHCTIGATDAHVAQTTLLAPRALGPLPHCAVTSAAT